MKKFTLYWTVCAIGINAWFYVEHDKVYLGDVFAGCLLAPLVPAIAVVALGTKAGQSGLNLCLKGCSK